MAARDQPRSVSNPLAILLLDPRATEVSPTCTIPSRTQPHHDKGRRFFSTEKKDDYSRQEPLRIRFGKEKVHYPPLRPSINRILSLIPEPEPLFDWLLRPLEYWPLTFLLTIKIPSSRWSGASKTVIPKDLSIRLMMQPSPLVTLEVNEAYVISEICGRVEDQHVDSKPLRPYFAPHFINSFFFPRMQRAPFTTYKNVEVYRENLQHSPPIRYDKGYSAPFSAHEAPPPPAFFLANLWHVNYSTLTIWKKKLQWPNHLSLPLLNWVLPGRIPPEKPLNSEPQQRKGYPDSLTHLHRKQLNRLP